MMMKNFINKILDVPKLIRRLWLLLWILLVILLVMKFCFGIWYPIVSDNEIFNNICKFIDEREWIYKIITLILYVFSLNILCLTSMGKKKYDNLIWLIIVNLFIVFCGITKIINSILGNILEIIFLFLSFSIINIKCKNFNKLWKNILIPIFVYGFINIWQLSIYLVRGLNLQELNTYPLLIGIIIMIDYYIVIVINWIEVSYMGWFSAGWLFGKDITTLKAMKEKELKKAKPNMKKVNSLDIKIAELEKEGK